MAVTVTVWVQMKTAFGKARYPATFLGSHSHALSLSLAQHTGYGFRLDMCLYLHREYQCPLNFRPKPD